MILIIITETVVCTPSHVANIVVCMTDIDSVTFTNIVIIPVHVINQCMNEFCVQIAPFFLVKGLIIPIAQNLCYKPLL